MNQLLVQKLIKIEKKNIVIILNCLDISSRKERF
jgi:hypothetical protein